VGVVRATAAGKVGADHRRRDRDIVWGLTLTAGEFADDRAERDELGCPFIVLLATIDVELEVEIVPVVLELLQRRIIVGEHSLELSKAVGGDGVAVLGPRCVGNETEPLITADFPSQVVNGLHGRLNALLEQVFLADEAVLIEAIVDRAEFLV